jgi:hypothetical protein
MTLLKVLLLTLVLELPVAWLYHLRSPSALLAVAGINCLTNPSLNYLLQLYPAAYAYAPILELIVIVVEGALLSLVLTDSRRRLFSFSMTANLFSWLFGSYILWPWLSRWR